MLLVVMDEDENGGGPELEHAGDGLRIQFKGKMIVTDPDGTERSEYACQTWSFSNDTGFLLTINFGTERKPRITYAGTAQTPASHIGEAIASAIRGVAIPPESEQ